jgi:hypothetical protein
VNFYERAIKALNAAEQEEAGRDAIAQIQAAMQDARDDAFEEAAGLLRAEVLAPVNCQNRECRCQDKAHVLGRAADALLRRKGSVSR